MKETRKSVVQEGLPHPCGASWDGKGTNFALFSTNATKVELCLFDERGERELERIALPLSTPTRFGTVTCLTLDLPLFTDTASTGLMSRRRVSDLIPTSFCWIPTPVVTQVN